MSNHRIAVFGSGVSGLLAQQLDSAKATRDLGFEQGVKAERERSAGLIEAAKGLSQSSKDYDDSNDCGEMYWAERMSEPVDLLIQALNEYEESINDK